MHWEVHKSLRMPRQQMHQGPWSSVTPPLDAHLSFIIFKHMWCYSNKVSISEWLKAALSVPDTPEQLTSKTCCLLG